MMDRRLNVFIPLLLFLFVAALLPSLPGMEYDIRNCWQPWALHIYRNSLRDAYGSDTDYMPIYQYILWVYVKIEGSEKAIVDNICFLRCSTLLVDFFGIWYVYKWIDKKVAWYAILVISILNLGYSYDTIIWGQMDGILSAFVFISIYYAWKGNNLWSAVWLVLAFNFKIQAIIIIPVWGLLFLNNFLEKRQWKNIVRPVGAMVLVQALLVIPFTRGHFGLWRIVYVVVHSFNKYHSISIKAANIWHWLVPDNPNLGDTLLFTDDTKVWVAGLTYKQVGLSLFFITSFFALLPMMILVYKRWKNDNENRIVNRQLVWLTAAMVYMLFYFFNTEIHERYCQPSFIFITAYAFFSGDFIVYVLFSVMYFLTLEYSMHHLQLARYDTFIFDYRFLSAINALIILLLVRKIYKYYRLSVSEPEVVS
jgi:Gpi18-like mannosyltransferase